MAVARKWDPMCFSPETKAFEVFSLVSDQGNTLWAAGFQLEEPFMRFSWNRFALTNILNRLNRRVYKLTNQSRASRATRAGFF